MSTPSQRLFAAEDVVKRYGPTTVLKGASVEIASGEIHSLFGGNGSGKSTLIKVLAGVESADTTGSLRIAGQNVTLPHWSSSAAAHAGLRIVHQDLGLFPALSVAENLAIGAGFPTTPAGRIRWRQVRDIARASLAKLEITLDLDRPLGTLRVSDQALIAVARALRGADDLTALGLLLDEPTAALPKHEVDVLFTVLRRLARQGAAVLFVSHRVDEVLELSDRVTILRDGRAIATEPTVAMTKTHLIDALTATQVSRTTTTSTRPITPRNAGNAPTAALEARSLRAPGSAPVDLSVARGEIVGIAGLLGSGRSSLLRALYGLHGPSCDELLIDEQPTTVGNLRAALRAGLAYLPEQRSEVAYFDLTVAQNLLAGRMAEAWHKGRFERRSERAIAVAAVSDYAVKTASLDLPLAALSGGNQQKVMLARLLITRPRILLLDEPTQGVDVAARAELWKIIRRHCAAGGAALAVCSDPEELAEYVDRVVVMTRHGVSTMLRRPNITAAEITAAINDEEFTS